MGQYQVIAMTVITGGSNHKSGLKQTPAMDTLGIILNNIMLGDIIYPGNYLTLFVASAAKVGDIHLIGARFGIAVMEYIMMTVALFTVGRMCVICQQSLSVDPSSVFGHLNGMARSAIDRFQIVGMWKSFICRIGMAGETGVAVVD